MRISQVAESASKTSPEALAEVPGVTWRDVRGIRARIVHDYRTIDVLIIRCVVSRQLPSLIASVRRALVVDEKQRQRGDTTPLHASPATTGPRRRRPPA
jgi:uncharacterized protein with HEPN domain